VEREFHQPVLKEIALDFLIADLNGVYVDATVGDGGHAEEILKRISRKGTLIGFDVDDDALQISEKRLVSYENKILLRENFINIHDALFRRNVQKICGCLLDIGVSSRQLDDRQRGFSFRGDAQLDFRMNRTQELTGEVVVNEYSEESLAEIFWKYGEERYARKIAKRIVTERVKKKIVTTTQLKEIVQKCIGGKFLVKSLARIFQAIRMDVNNELENLSFCLEQAIPLLLPSGRIVVISYHSGEDRIVKQCFLKHSQNSFHDLKILTKKPIVPTSEEISNNSRARSAKLRVAEKM
jgi:16S rRNA (cytosine1402-N4)-methyltransferase